MVAVQQKAFESYFAETREIGNLLQSIGESDGQLVETGQSGQVLNALNVGRLGDEDGGETIKIVQE